MRLFLQITAALALLLTIGPPLAFCADWISLLLVKKLMLISSAVWFISVLMLDHTPKSDPHSEA